MSTPKIKISQMSSATSLFPVDTMMVVQNNVNKKVSISTFLKNMNSADSIRINPSQNAIDISLSSKNDANTIFIKGTNDSVGIGTYAPESKLHVSGNLQVGSSTTNGITVQSTEVAAFGTNTVSKEISATRAASLLQVAAGFIGVYVMPAGHNGQIKTIAVSMMDTGLFPYVTLTGLGYNKITFNNVGSSVVLQYMTSINKWVVLSKNGADLSTV